MYKKPKNKQFAMDLVLKIKKLNPQDFQILLDKDKCSRILKGSYNFAIIREIQEDDDVSKICKINGYRRYYNEIWHYEGKKFVITNDWYLPSKTHNRDNRSPVVKWLDLKLAP